MWRLRLAEHWIYNSGICARAIKCSTSEIVRLSERKAIKEMWRLPSASNGNIIIRMKWIAFRVKRRRQTNQLFDWVVGACSVHSFRPQHVFVLKWSCVRWKNHQRQFDELRNYSKASFSNCNGATHTAFRVTIYCKIFFAVFVISLLTNMTWWCSAYTNISPTRHLALGICECRSDWLPLRCNNYFFSFFIVFSSRSALVNNVATRSCVWMYEHVNRAMEAKKLIFTVNRRRSNRTKWKKWMKWILMKNGISQRPTTSYLSSSSTLFWTFRSPTRRNVCIWHFMQSIRCLWLTERSTRLFKL